MTDETKGIADLIEDAAAAQAEQKSAAYQEKLAEAASLRERLSVVAQYIAQVDSDVEAAQKALFDFCNPQAAVRLTHIDGDFHIPHRGAKEADVTPHSVAYPGYEADDDMFIEEESAKPNGAGI